ncbi:MAG: hypothetical protein F6K24_48265 [Okeania sp. SIO2D1]|nr:hypothetical protein [Okeania sp. SIO2D1]
MIIQPKLSIFNFGVGKLVYDINLNSLGVRSQESGVRREERRRNSSRRRKFFGPVKVTQFYRALIWTWYHTSNYQRLNFLVVGVSCSHIQNSPIFRFW